MRRAMRWIVAMVILLAGSAFSQPFGEQGGGPAPMPTDELTERERTEIERTIEANSRDLAARGILSGIAKQPPALAWPLAPGEAMTDPGYHMISGFVDHNAEYPNKLTDYDCKQRTYDRADGYNHQGVDMATWPFQWDKLLLDQVEVRAAAPGVIVHKQDGNPDMNCSDNVEDSVGQPWNAVYLEHSDGSRTWYGHLKKSSLTSKNVGDAVTEGEYLGVVASSGNSTGPHLHFEIRNASGGFVDPYAGTCNTDVESSLWQDQRDYFDSHLNALRATSSAPVVGGCPTELVDTEDQTFEYGEEIFLTAYYRDQLGTQSTTYKVLRPDGSIQSEWTHSMDVAHYPASYWWWSNTLSESSPSGEWTFVAEYEGQVEETTFTLGGEVETSSEGTGPADLIVRLTPVFPNPISSWAEFEISAGAGQFVSVRMFDAMGRLVRILHEGALAGDQRKTVLIDRTGLAPGPYHVRAQSVDYSDSQIVMVVGG